MAKNYLPNHKVRGRNPPAINMNYKEKTMLEKFLTLQLDRMEMTELLAMHAFAESLVREHEAFGVTISESIQDNKRSLKNEIKARMADAHAKRLRDAKSRLASLDTPEERRSKLRQEIAELEKLAAQ